MTHVIVLRFSAMGDVLMTIPVIDSFARQHPDVRVTVVSRPWAQPLFSLLPSNVGFMAADLKGEHAGYHGLNLLARRLFALQPTHIADLHDAHIRKDRRARKAFLSAEVKVPQTSMFEKYVDVFRRLGFDDWSLDFKSLYPQGGADLSTAVPSFDPSLRPERHWVAIAPFSIHEGKTYPQEQMEEVIRQLNARGDTRIFLFGAGKTESEILDQWAERYAHAENMAGKLNNMAEELALISHCRVMVSMDSGNMHLAALAAVPVVSIWGATHPFAGFLGYGQCFKDVLQRTDLPCRPCSIYGKEPCQFGDYRCLTGITPESVVKKIEERLPD